MTFVAIKPDTKPLGLYHTMADAQEAIAMDEPDILKQAQYQIHPVPDDPVERADMSSILKLKITETWAISKFDGEYVGQDPVEVVELGQVVYSSER